MSIHSFPEKSLASQALSEQFDILLRQNLDSYVDPVLVSRLESLAETAGPPFNNMGGTYPLPPLFIAHCEKSPQNVVVNKTKIDFLAFTVSVDLDAIKILLAVVWPSVVFSVRERGMVGYGESISIMVDGVQFGLIGFGAAHGRNFVSLTGVACKTLNDELVAVFCEALGYVDASISRIDLALDCYNGERTWDHARWAFDQGAFMRSKASRLPQLKIVGTTSGGENLGRTMYVGKREGSHVFGRIYEKGLEVYAKMPQEFKEMSAAREIVMGVKPEFADTWVRLEVEYKRVDKDRPLPLDMMLRRDEYFAGAYPYFADALGVVDGVRPTGVRSDFDVDFVAMIANAKKSYGSLVHSMKELGFTDSDVVEYLSTGRNNDRLVKSGLFARIKQSVDEFKDSCLDWDIPF